MSISGLQDDDWSDFCNAVTPANKLKSVRDSSIEIIRERKLSYTTILSDGNYRNERMASPTRGGFHRVCPDLVTFFVVFVFPPANRGLLLVIVHLLVIVQHVVLLPPIYVI